jgi:micrococcal nuclease
MDALGLLPTSTPTQIPTFTSTLLPTSTTTVTAVPTKTKIPTYTPTPLPTLPGANSFSCIPRVTKRETGTVVGVIDGDTVDVQLEDGQVYRVRYIGMDTPEQGELFYNESTAKNSELVAWQEVILIQDVSETDQYDRLLRYVIVGDTFVNYELVREGFAQPATFPPDVACVDVFKAAQENARKDEIGLWAPTPTPYPTSLPPPPTQAASGGSTEGGDSDSSICSCSGNTYNCGDFSTHNQAQACYNYCISEGRGDIHRLDGDNDGLACESLP